MLDETLLTGPSLTSLESHLFDALTDEVGTQPASVLYLAPQDHPRDGTEDRWDSVGPPQSLRTETLDGFVSDCYERDQYKGRVTHVDRPLLFRLVELGVESIQSPDNPLNAGTRFPRAGLTQEAESLFTDLEFAGLLSAEDMQERLASEGLGERADHVAELAASINDARDEILADEQAETYRTERMAQVISTETPFTELFPAVDAVVCSGFSRFDALERAFVARIREEWPTTALLPRQIESDDAVGVDVATENARRTYEELGFTREHHVEPSPDPITARRRLTRSLYRHPDDAPDTDPIESTELDLTYIRCETALEEVRHVARSIRAAIGEGTDPETIGVVLTSPIHYADRVQEIFDQYGFPYALDVEVPLSETALGGAVELICDLAREPRGVDTVLDLLTNPLVDVSDHYGALDHQELARVVARVETSQLETVREHLNEPTNDAVESLLADLDSLPTTPLVDLPSEFETLLTRLGVAGTFEADADVAEGLSAQEVNADERLERVLKTLALTAPVADPDIGDTVDRLQRALSGVSVRTGGRSSTGRVVVCPLGEAVFRDFEETYVLGVTATHVPSDPEQMAFSRPIYEAHPDFEQADKASEARYHLGTVLGSAGDLTLSAPQRSVDGDPYVEADLLTELRRVIDVDAITVESPMSTPGSQEDVQRTIGKVQASDTERAAGLIEAATDADTFDEQQRERIEAGSACAAGRASEAISPYDGRLSPEMVSRVHPESDRTPYSPSRLETYAACGFKYYMRRVLGIKAPDPLTREPDPGTRGSFIHSVLEHYYRSLQTRDGEPVHPGGDFDARQERLRTVALDHLDGTFDEHPDTGFQDEWLTSVLGGLGSPADNDYYGPDRTTETGEPELRGLFYRFLEHEFDEPAKTTARPTWFEARIGNPHDSGTQVSSEPARIETPAGPVPVHGLIDRVDTVPGTDPTQLAVRDYKTGTSIPSANDALLGLNFQLPLYGLMAEDALDDVETVGATYYQVAPPDSVNSRKGLVTSQPMASYYKSDDVETPLLRYSYPHFETHEAFRRFLEDRTATRLGELATGISEGLFHPTVLDPEDAGCRYCDYAHVCDVRSHQRRTVIEDIDDQGLPAYVPPIARDIEPEDAVEVR